MIHRRGLMAATAAVSLVGARAWAQPVSLSTQPAAPFFEVETASGHVRGGQARGAIAFKGIPYAGSVSGANRFKAAPAVTPWTGVFDATHLGPPTLQTPKSTYGENEPAYSEDCLVLNVWTPPGFKAGEKRPVMVYFHGGGYSTGSAGSGSQDGGRLAAVYDVVVVAPNHRLGLLGFLWLGDLLGPDYATSGNQGMLDMVASLQWVRDNIAAFGGDPGNVTILGESGGGAKVGTLMGMPAASGLFHKAGIESGAQLKRMTRATAAETARRLMKALGLADARTLIDVPAQKLLELQWAAEGGKGPLMQATPGYAAPPAPAMMDIAFSESTRAGEFAPMIDGAVLPADPFDPAVTALCADVPLMIGSNKEEASFFFMGQPDMLALDEAGLKARLASDFGGQADEILATYRSLRPGATPADLYIAIVTARSMGDETVVLAGRKAQQPAPVYAYRWDYASNFAIPGTTRTLGAGHASDIGPTFYNWDKGGLHGNGPGVEAASRHFSALWTSFARTGVPSATGVPAWPRYEATTRATMLVDVDCRVVNDPDATARKMWERI